MIEVRHQGMILFVEPDTRKIVSVNDGGFRILLACANNPFASSYDANIPMGFILDDNNIPHLQSEWSADTKTISTMVGQFGFRSVFKLSCAEYFRQMSTLGLNQISQVRPDLKYGDEQIIVTAFQDSMQESLQIKPTFVEEYLQIPIHAMFTEIWRGIINADNTAQ